MRFNVSFQAAGLEVFLELFNLAGSDREQPLSLLHSLIAFSVLGKEDLGGFLHLIMGSDYTCILSHQLEVLVILKAVLLYL